MQNFVKLQFSDGRNDVEGLQLVNEILTTVGVRASTIAIPAEANPIVLASQSRAITDEEQQELISIFSLDRADLLEQIDLAGRTPEVTEGGHLTTAEGNTPSYPKVYDMQAMTHEMRLWALNRYGRLHVNTSEDGTGIDEVMTVVSGGPFTWCYVLPDGVIARLTVESINPEGPAIRLSYPGRRIHAGYMDPARGLIVAYAHGPETFTIRFEKTATENSELLNTNPWVDFSGDEPRLHATINQ